MELRSRFEREIASGLTASTRSRRSNPADPQLFGRTPRSPVAAAGQPRPCNETPRLRLSITQDPDALHVVRAHGHEAESVAGANAKLERGGATAPFTTGRSSFWHGDVRRPGRTGDSDSDEVDAHWKRRPPAIQCPCLLTPRRLNAIHPGIRNQLAEVLVEVAGLTYPQKPDRKRLPEHFNLSIEITCPG